MAKLEMKGNCEGCQASLLPSAEAYICSFECTFCPGCASKFRKVCPNCGGELVARPRRRGVAESAPAVIGQPCGPSMVL